MNLLRFVFVIFLVLFSQGCARPKYIQQEQNRNQQSISAASCSVSFKFSDLCLTWNWEVLPTSTQNGSIVFKTFRLNKYDRSPILVDLPSVPELVLWMPSMGHGSTLTTTEQIDTGTYKSKNVYFIMPGQWELKFQTLNKADVIDEAVVQIYF